MSRECVVCGDSFEPPAAVGFEMFTAGFEARSRYCGDECRKAAQEFGVTQARFYVTLRLPPGSEFTPEQSARLLFNKWRLGADADAQTANIDLDLGE